MFPGAVLRGTLIALALLSARGFPASADDGRPPAPSGPDHPPSSSPPLTELRPSDIQSAPVPSIAPGSDPFFEPPPAREHKRELVLFVGGYGSRVDDGAFDELGARFPPDRYEVRRLGDDPRFPYDTYGSVDMNAQVLTDEIRAVGADYTAVNIVSHSMGGVVTDRAFASGLSAGDGVRTFVAIAGPHSGADYARAPAFLLPIIGPVEDIVRLVGVAAARDPASEAVHDLALARPIPPPAGVARVDASLATDGLVNQFDARDPGVPQRLFMPASLRELIDGHGGSLVNRQIADLVVETVRTHEVPPDRRDPITRLAAPFLWDQETRLWRRFLFLVTLSAACLYAARWVPFCRRAIDGFNAWCGRVVRALGR
jgi:predicted alpha/beta hydrolase family esterase